MATQYGETQVATASYIEHMLAELRSMSTAINANFLSYLLEMAIAEAAEVANGKSDRPTNPQNTVSAEELARLYMSGGLE